MRSNVLIFTFMDVFGIIAKDSLCLVLDPKGLFLCFLYNTEKLFSIKVLQFYVL